MTKLLEQAIDQIEKLPDDAQDAIAAQLLAVLADDAEWEVSFTTTDAQWDRMISMVQQELAEGNTKDMLP